MGTIERFLSPPAASLLPVLPVLVYLLMGLLLSFSGVLLVVSALALATQKQRGELSRLCLALISPKISVWLFWGVLPYVTLLLLLILQFDGWSLPVGALLLRTLGLFLLALGLLFAYRRTGGLWLGLAGNLLLALALFFTSALQSLLSYPEKWPVIHAPLPPVFSWNVIAHFALWSALFALLTGATLLFVRFRGGEGRLAHGAVGRREMRWIGQGLLTLGALGAPVALLWNLLTAPLTGMSMAVFAAALGALLLLFLVVTLSLWLAPEQSPRLITAVFVLSLLSFAAVLFQDQAVQAAANEDLHRVLAQKAESQRQLDQQAQEKRYPKIEADLALGETIFQKRCSACHRFDTKLVGPPYNSVIPKYLGKPEELKAFLRSPVKRDPAYPPMPAQGLGLVEVESIAAYLLKHFEGATPAHKEEKP